MITYFPIHSPQSNFLKQIPVATVFFITITRKEPDKLAFPHSLCYIITIEFA